MRLQMYSFSSFCFVDKNKIYLIKGLLLNIKTYDNVINNKKIKKKKRRNRLKTKITKTEFVIKVDREDDVSFLYFFIFMLLL
jgi:hypothetical protein